MSTNKVKTLTKEEKTEVNISLRKLQETLEVLGQQRDKYTEASNNAHYMALRADGAMDVLRQLIKDTQKEGEVNE